MKRVLMVVMGALGASAFWRRKGRSDPADLAPDPAAELRARLNASKVTADGTGMASPALHPDADVQDVPSAAEADVAPEDPAARRAAIHDRARGAIDELR